MNSPRALPTNRVTLIGLPFDENSSYLKGAAEAPPLIRDAFWSESSNPYSESGVDLSAPGLLADAGDVAPTASETMRTRIDEAVDRCLRQNLHPIALGGDHAVTYPILRAFGRKFPKLSLLHFDAHPDLYDEFSGNRFSHACPFARIMEEKLVGRLVQVGIRAATAHQRTQAARFGVEMREMRDGPVRENLAFDTPLYISFDMDALDPAFAPGVSHPEPGGLSTRDALAIIGAIDVPIVGADVVEFNPARDRSGLTAMTAAKLVKEIAARMLETLPLLVTA